MDRRITRSNAESTTVHTTIKKENSNSTNLNSVKFELNDVANVDSNRLETTSSSLSRSLSRRNQNQNDLKSESDSSNENNNNNNSTTIRTRSSQSKSSLNNNAEKASTSKSGSQLDKRRSSNQVKLNLSSTGLSQMETRKRHLSVSSDQNNLKLNDSQFAYENEDSNSSSIGLTSSLSSSFSSTLFNASKRLKLNKHKDFDSSDPFANSTANLESLETLSNQNYEASQCDDKQLVIKCPIIGCDSSGHLDGLSSRHASYDACPIYFGMSKEECVLRRKAMEKNISELNRKLILLNESKKNLRNKCVNEEQMKYMSKVNAQLKELVRIANEASNCQEENTINPDIIDDIKNINTSVLLNSITSAVAPTPIARSVALTAASVNPVTPKAPCINDLKVSKLELDLFRDAVIASTVNSDEVKSSRLPLTSKDSKLIQFGNYEIETWYKSPYPDDFWQLEKIFICQYCLKYLKSHGVLNRHLEKCLWRHPPGREIYRKDQLSFFEVDGKFNKVYCQNLCLLAKLFLDHKTLYFDVEPFLFYVLTQYNSSSGSFQMVGYFSKEKQSLMNYNLSCILTLPPYMNKGYGKLLIDFSYLLSQVEEKLGSPERPLSDLGLISYRSYWKTQLLMHLSKYLNESEISIKDLSQETRILTNDIISTCQYMGLIKYWKGKHVLLKNKEIINKSVQKKKTSIEIDPSCLKWTPYVIQQPIINDMYPISTSHHSLSMHSNASSINSSSMFY